MANTDCFNVSYHIIFILHKNAELLQERHNKNQQLKVVPIQGLHQHVHNVLVPHLQLGARILSKIQKQVEGNWKSQRDEKQMTGMLKQEFNKPFLVPKVTGVVLRKYITVKFLTGY